MTDEPRALQADPLEVLVEGRTFTAWESVEVVRPLNAAAGAFRLSAVPSPRRAWPVRPQDELQVLLDDEPVITGFVDGIEGESSAEGRRLSVVGRDRSQDLVDSSALVEPGEFRGRTLVQLVEAFAAPFDVGVLRRIELVGEPFEVFRVEPGETAWQAIERACRLRGVLASPAGDGRLVLERPAAGRADVELVEGENVETASLRWSDAERHSYYIVRGQRPGSDQEFGAIVAEVQGEAFDEEMRRYRPLLVNAEGAVTTEDAERRAQWEATNRAARASRLVVKVPEWRQERRRGSRVWRPNETVFATVPSLQVVRRELLVDRVSLERSEAGTSATLQLVRPDAYQLQPVLSPDLDPFRGIAEEELEDEVGA